MHDVAQLTRCSVQQLPPRLMYDQGGPARVPHAGAGEQRAQ